MAISSPFLATSLLLCSLLVIASANDYGAYDYGAKPVDQQQLEKEEKPDYVYKPRPEETANPGSSAKPVNQPQAEQPSYGTEPNSYKPQPEEAEKPGYRTKPVYQPQPEKEEKPDRGTENNFYQQQPVENQKPDFENKAKPDYDTNPNINKPQPDAYEKPDLYPTTPEVLPIGVEGLVLCKSGFKYYPIQGALARITCLVVDENGYEKTHSVCSGETDAKGYFFARLSPLELSKLRDCKAFLESSPLETCNVPVDVNKGISGASLSDFRVLDHMGMKLFSVGPFFFTSQPNSVPNGY
ncbi:hypothetical protein HRI_003554900 [Hibiscus trionum]|uniref:Pollen Ole e 1 allergen and extensin family protein n=1 Tax=Hibiscus trionum TaxID=183268 RepID=A0A9W7MFP2_HIBTR|nr:hypothetical protein HRI_003554900 [Hibiscus trionum]